MSPTDRQRLRSVLRSHLPRRSASTVRVRGAKVYAVVRYRDTMRREIERTLEGLFPGCRTTSGHYSRAREYGCETIWRLNPDGDDIAATVRGLHEPPRAAEEDR